MNSPICTSLLALTLTVASSCSSSEPRERDRPVESADDATVLGHLETREHRVTWLVTSGAPLFTVRTKDGALLASELSSEQVAERFPSLRDMIRSAVAQPDGAILDASKLILDASGGYYGD